MTLPVVSILVAGALSALAAAQSTVTTFQVNIITGDCTHAGAVVSCPPGDYALWTARNNSIYAGGNAATSCPASQGLNCPTGDHTVLNTTIPIPATPDAGDNGPGSIQLNAEVAFGQSLYVDGMTGDLKYFAPLTGPIDGDLQLDVFTDLFTLAYHGVFSGKTTFSVRFNYTGFVMCPQDAGDTIVRAPLPHLDASNCVAAPAVAGLATYDAAANGNSYGGFAAWQYD